MVEENFRGRIVIQKQFAVFAEAMPYDIDAECVVVGVGGFQLSPLADTALVHSDLAHTVWESTEPAVTAKMHTALERTSQVHTAQENTA